MWMQPLLDFTDVAILVAFAASTLALIVYVWRAEHGRRHNRLS